MTGEPRLLPSNVNWTLAMPTLSEALAEMVVLPDRLAPPAGAEIETVGVCVSTVVTPAT